MHRPVILVVIGGLAVLGAVAATGTFWYERPTRLTVAVAQADEPDRALLDSATQLLRRSRNAVRLQVQVVPDAKAASEAVDAHRADLAVIRTDVAIPGDAQTVVILHRDSAVLVAPTSSGLKSIADLPGHAIGVLRLGAGNRSLLSTALTEADLQPDSVTEVELAPGDVEAALRSKRVAAVMAVDVVSGSALRSIVRTVSTVDPPIAAPSPAATSPAVVPVPPAGKSGTGKTGAAARGKRAAKNLAKDNPPAPDKPAAGAPDKDKDNDEDDAKPEKGTVVFIPFAEAEAIAERSPAYEKTEVARGIFGGTPPRPGKSYNTLSITHRLVANENVSQDVVAGLTRFFLTEKGPIAATAPIAMRIEAPNTDKGASLPVHAGSAAYIDDDEQTFFDKYSDFIYIGAMLIGVLASGVTALMGRIQSQRTASLDTSVGRLIEMMGLARSASTQETLDTLQAEADGLMAQALQAATSVGGEDRRLTVFGMALDQLRAAVRDRRAELRRPGAPVGALANAAE